MTHSTAEDIAIGATGVLAPTVAALTLLPGEKLPIRPIFNDKVNHMIAWGALTFPVAAARPAAIKWLFPVAIGAGFAVELIQPTVGRKREAGDLLADTVGAAIGCLSGWLLNNVLRPTGPRSRA